MLQWGRAIVRAQARGRPVSLRCGGPCFNGGARLYARKPEAEVVEQPGVLASMGRAIVRAQAQQRWLTRATRPELQWGRAIVRAQAGRGRPRPAPAASASMGAR